MMNRTADIVRVTTFRDALAHVATPVSVVTTADGSGRARGVTVGTFCSLSLDPPLVMFCLNRSAGSHEAMTTTSRFLIHVLRDDQAAVAARFSRAGIDRFAGLSGDWHGLPTIPGTMVRLACARYANVPAGDHTIVMCLVTDAEFGTGSPLLSYAREYCSPLPLPRRSLTQPMYLLVTLPLRRVARSQSQGSGHAMSEPVLVRVHALDPISESGILAQLRKCPDIQVADTVAAGGTPSVAMAVADSVDDDATCWLRGLHRCDSLPIVLVVGQFDSRALITVVESGVRAVIRRCEATPARLAQLLHAAAANRGELPSDLLGQLLDQVGHLNRSLLGPRGLGLNGLTHRESTILRLAADGLSTREIASQLAYSERTIKAVIQELTTRLYFRNRTHAVAHAVRNGWI